MWPAKKSLPDHFHMEISSQKLFKYHIKRCLSSTGLFKNQVRKVPPLISESCWYIILKLQECSGRRFKNDPEKSWKPWLLYQFLAHFYWGMYLCRYYQNQTNFKLEKRHCPPHNWRDKGFQGVPLWILSVNLFSRIEWTNKSSSFC